MRAGPAPAPQTPPCPGGLRVRGAAPHGERGPARPGCWVPPPHPVPGPLPGPGLRKPGRGQFARSLCRREGKGGAALGSPGIASSAPLRPLAAAGRAGGGRAGGGALPSSLRLNSSKIWKKNPSFAVTATPRPRPAQGKRSLGL